MATSYKIRLKRFNGTDYDTLNLISDNIIMSSGNNLQTDYNNLDGAIDDIVYVGDDAPTDPNTKIWLDTDASGASAVNSVNGKAGTVVLDAEDVGAMSEWDLLWTNASPTSSFSAQTISINLSGYDFVLITSCLATTAAYQDNSMLIRIGDTFRICGTDNANNTFSREGQVTSSGVQFNTGQTGTSGVNTSRIPLKIYGIKGVS